MQRPRPFLARVGTPLAFRRRPGRHGQGRIRRSRRRFFRTCTEDSTRVFPRPSQVRRVCEAQCAIDWRRRPCASCRRRFGILRIAVLLRSRALHTVLRGRLPLSRLRCLTLRCRHRCSILISLSLSLSLSPSLSIYLAHGGVSEQSRKQRLNTIHDRVRQI